MRPVETEKPTIVIIADPDHGRSETLNQLRYGIEEENVPFVFYEKKATTADELAWEAAQRSRLDVGIGLSDLSLVLYYEKMGENHPLFSISSRSPEWQVRALGSNAARLVKKLPFKSMDGEREVRQ